MDILQDLFYTNKKVLFKTLKTVFKTQELFIIGIPYLLIPMIVFSMAGALSFLAGIIIFACISAVISDYLYVIEFILKHERFSWDAFKVGYKVYFRNIFGTLFVLYLVNYGIGLFISPILSILPFGGLIIWLIQLGIVLILNPLPEVFYQKKYDELDSLNYSIFFMKKNPIDWIVPNIVLGLGTYFVYRSVFSLVSILTYSLSYAVSLPIIVIVVAILLQVVVGFSLVYRGYLFNILDNSTRRKRLFKRHM
jgi:hypothetical protein